MKHVVIDTEVEAFPVLAITLAALRPDARHSFEIPDALWNDLVTAREQTERAELAIMRHVAATYPDSSGAVQDWIKDHE